MAPQPQFLHQRFLNSTVTSVTWTMKLRIKVSPRYFRVFQSKFGLGFFSLLQFKRNQRAKYRLGFSIQSLFSIFYIIQVQTKKKWPCYVHIINSFTCLKAMMRKIPCLPCPVVGRFSNGPQQRCAAPPRFSGPNFWALSKRRGETKKKVLVGNWWWDTVLVPLFFLHICISLLHMLTNVCFWRVEGLFWWLGGNWAWASERLHKTALAY